MMHKITYLLLNRLKQNYSSFLLVRKSLFRKLLKLSLYLVCLLQTSYVWAQSVDQTLESMQSYVKNKDAQQIVNQSNVKTNASPTTNNSAAPLPYAPQAPLLITPGVKPPSLLPQPNTPTEQNTSSNSVNKKEENSTKEKSLPPSSPPSGSTNEQKDKSSVPASQPAKPAVPPAPASPWLAPNPWQNTQNNPWKPQQYNTQKLPQASKGSSVIPTKMQNGMKQNQSIFAPNTSSSLHSTGKMEKHPNIFG